jgi:hypothetical protein
MKKFVLGFIITVLLLCSVPVYANSEFNHLLYKDNYQQEIIRLKQLPQTDEIKSQLETLVYYRMRKIATNFETLEKYLTEEDFIYLDGVDIACFSDAPAKIALKDYIYNSK